MGITRQEALELFRSDDFVGLGQAADQVRRRLHPENVVTYQIDRNINYTNFCTEYCSFCAFYRPMGSPEGYLLNLDTIYGKIDETLALGGTGILLQGGLHRELKIDYYENLLHSLKRRYPQVKLHCFSAPEVLNIAELSGLTLAETIRRLHEAGKDSIPGGGAADSGRDRRPACAGRVHRFHPLDVPAGAHRARARHPRAAHGGGLPEDARHLAALPRQHSKPAIDLAHARPQDLPD